MKKILFVLVISLFSVVCLAQSKPMLLGICSRADFEKEPYSTWFSKNYADYMPSTEIISQLKSLDFKDYSIMIFLGTWCGDSHREVPRFVKVLDEIGFSQSAVTMVALSNVDSVYKQSPTHEEQGRHIYRVPTFIVSKKGEEVNRIIEFPVLTLEQDLLAILRGDDYTPNYSSYVHIANWLDKGYLTSDNISYRGLANQIRGLTRSAGELYTLGYVVSKQGAEGLKAAVNIYDITIYLYPDNYWAYANLAIAMGEQGKYAQAAKLMQKVFEMNDNPKNIAQFLELYDIVRDRVD